MSSENDPLLVLDLQPNDRETAQKPVELIHIRGHQNLTLHARRTITLLWHNAHMDGIRRGKDYQIEIADLIGSEHKGYEAVERSVEDLMQTLLIVKMASGETRRVQFLGGNDMAESGRRSGVLSYSFDNRLVEILEDSRIWGTISLPVLVALSSKYAVSLYEHISQMAKLKYKESYTYELEEFRELMGVPEDKYKTFGALKQSILTPAVAEINALAPFNLWAMPIRTGRKVTHIKISWYTKDLHEVKEAWKELQQPKFGRKARIQGNIETVMGAIGTNQVRARLGKK